MAHYCALLALLVELSELVDITDENEAVTLAPAVLSELASARIDDTAKKMRMHQVGARLRQKLGSASDVRIRAGFSNAEPLLEAFVPLTGSDRVGWQYQQTQFRLALILDSKKGPAISRAERESHAREKYLAWFDVAELASHFAATRPGRGKLEFNGYEPDFVYRYCFPLNLTVGTLLDVGVDYVQRARAFAQRVHPPAGSA